MRIEKSWKGTMHSDFKKSLYLEISLHEHDLYGDIMCCE